MKKILILVVIVFSITFLTGCQNNSVETLSENMRKIELTSNLVTYEAYYHNVIEYEKDKGKGVTHFLEEDRKLFAEYTAKVKFGIDLSKVKIEVKGNTIDVFIPRAKIIGVPSVDESTFKPENFIESKEGLNKNKIDGDDMTKAFDKAQKDTKDNASKDEELLNLAQKRAKNLIEEQIKQLSGLSENEYTINWEYE